MSLVRVRRGRGRDNLPLGLARCGCQHRARMADPRDKLSDRLRALIGGDGDTLREVERILDRSADSVGTSRIGRAFKMGKLAASSGTKLAMSKAKGLLGGEGKLSKADGVALALEMVETFSELRGVAMKIGQMLSYVDDSLPPEARRVLALLQRDAPPMPFATVKQRVEAELGRTLAEAYAEFDEVPLAAASIGQVHRARLHPDGDGTPGLEVAVKVQYPGIDQAMSADLENGKILSIFQRALFFRTDTAAILGELEQRLLDECDYRKEAEYQDTFRARFTGHPFIVVPEVHRSHSTQRVLTTTLYRGLSFHQWLDANPSAAERERACRTFYRFYLGSFYIDGLFNCDPHPGNYIFLEDGKICFLDYGCSRPFPPERRRAWIDCATAVRRDEPAELERVGRQVGFLPPEVKEFDRDAFRTLMRHLYAPYLEDVAYDFSRHRPQETFRRMFTDNPNLFKLNMPADAVFLNRITFGLVSLLTDIGAPLNCYRLADAYFARRDPDWPDDPVLARERAA